MIFDALAPQGIAGPDYLLMSGVVLVGALLQGVGGIGFAMFSAPLAGLFFPGLAPGPLLALGGAVSLMSALRERAHVDWPLVGVTLLGRFAGSATSELLEQPYRYCDRVEGRPGFRFESKLGVGRGEWAGRFLRSIPAPQAQKIFPTLSERGVYAASAFKISKLHSYFTGCGNSCGEAA